MSKNREVNIKVIAEKAGVSVATVSRVLNGLNGVRDKTRKKILKVSKELNYQINVGARNLKLRKSFFIGIVVGKVFSRFYSNILESIEAIAREHKYNVILTHHNDDAKEELECLKIMNSLRVLGIILLSTNANMEYVNFLLSSGTKIVLLDRLIDGVQCDAVLVDNKKGAYDAVKHLIECGYRKIGLINGSTNITSGKERLEGYMQALNDSDIKIDKRLIKNRNFTKESGLVLSNELIKGSIKPDAIFCTNLDLTLSTLITLKEEKIQIPDDIGFIGFDDSDWLNIFKPPISVVSYPIERFGRTAADMLMKGLEREERGEPVTISLSTNLIIRESTKKVK